MGPGHVVTFHRAAAGTPNSPFIPDFAMQNSGAKVDSFAKIFGAPGEAWERGMGFFAYRPENQHSNLNG
jgi:hypothetical protein